MNIKNVLGYKLGLSNRLVKRKMDQRISQYGITTSQWAVLKLLDERGEMSQKQIADELIGDKVTAGEMIKLLVKNGYVDRTSSAIDKRAYIVTMTDSSQALISEVEKISDDINAEALRGIDKKDINTFYKVLDQIVKNVE